MSSYHAGCRSFGLGILILVALAPLAPAGIINGDFETGDFTGWTASAIDGAFNPTAPLISVASVGGNQVAVFDTGDFNTGPFISTLEQTFTVDPATPFLTFDFSDPFTSADATGTGAGPFLDAFAVSLQSGADFYDLLVLDQFGPWADPFGTAPGTVALGTSLAPSLDFSARADLSSLAGQSVTLYADMINEDDRFETTVWSDFYELQSQQTKKTVIPEPASLTLWSLLLAGVAAVRRQRHRRSHRAPFVSRFGAALIAPLAYLGQRGKR